MKAPKIVQKPDEDIKAPKIKNLFKHLNIDEAEIERIRKIRIENALRLLKVYATIQERGGTIHRSDPRTVAKNRRANRAARKQRKVNRERSRR